MNEPEEELPEDFAPFIPLTIEQILEQGKQHGLWNIEGDHVSEVEDPDWDAHWNDFVSKLEAMRVAKPQDN